MSSVERSCIVLFKNYQDGVKGIRDLLGLCGGDCIIAFNVCPDRKGQTTYSRDKAFELIEGMIGSSS